MITNRLKKKFRPDQVWTIGKRTIETVYENHGVTIGDQVKIVETIGEGGFYLVEDLKTGMRFDVTGVNLGRLVSE